MYQIYRSISNTNHTVIVLHVNVITTCVWVGVGPLSIMHVTQNESSYNCFEHCCYTHTHARDILVCLEAGRSEFGIGGVRISSDLYIIYSLLLGHMATIHTIDD